MPEINDIYILLCGTINYDLSINFNVSEYLRKLIIKGPRTI